MSKIKEYLTTILSARYGRDVRQSIHDAIEEINGVASTAQGSAAANAASAANSASAAKVSETAVKTSEEAAAQSEANAKTYADNAQAIAGAGIATQDTAGFMKGGDNYVDESGTLMLTKTTTDSTLLHSHAGGLEIKSVAGVSEQESTTGAQLFDKSALNTGYYDKSGAEVANTYWSNMVIPCVVGTNYTLSGSTTTNGDVNTVALDSDKNLISVLHSLDTEFTVRAPEGASFIAFSVKTSEADAIMINEGNTALPWEPFTNCAPSPSPSYPQEIKSAVVSEIKVSGKNLLKINATSKQTQGITFTINDDGSITANGTCTSRAQLALNNMTLDAGTYILSQGHVSASNSACIFISYTVNGRLCFVDLYDAEEGYKSFTLNDKTEIGIMADVRTKGMVVSNVKLYPMLRRADIKNDTFEPYTETAINLSEAITLNGIGEVKDKIVKDSLWGVERNIKKVVFDGSDDEAWSYNGYHEATGKVRYCITLSSVVSVADTDNVVRAIADKLRGGTRALLDENGVNSVFVGDGRRIFLVLSINDVGTQSATSLKTWLSNNPITVYYQTEATFEELPEADQIALHSLPTYDGVTYVAVDSEIKAGIEKVYGTSKLGAAMLLNKQNNVLQDIELAQYKNTVKSHTTSISNINSNFTALAKRVSKLEWIKSGVNCTGKMFAAVPDDVAEIRLVADLGGLGIHHEIPILQIDITDEMKYYRDGYVINIDQTTFQVNGGVVEFGIYTNGATLNLAYLNGEDVTDSTTWTFYYRKNS